MSVKDLREALDGPDGLLSAYLEVSSDAEIKADILAMIGDCTAKREHFAAMAMPAVLDVCHSDTRNPGETPEQMFARKAVACADALIAELAKVQP